MEHVMLDLETLGIQPGSAVVQIGAVDFDLNGNMGEGFNANISPRSCGEAGLTFDPDTICWWMGQPDAARSSVFTKAAPSLRAGIGRFNDWMNHVNGSIVWGNGAGFDNVLLSCAYHKLGMTRPWHYRNDRDMRTLTSLAKLMSIDVPWQRVGTLHVALDDAKTQALWTQKVLMQMKGMF